MGGEPLAEAVSALGMQLGTMFGIAVAVLAFVNGLLLLKRTLEDRPILRIKAVHPEVYQWYFPLPADEYKGHVTRKYGFLVYFDVVNRGRRAVQLDTWTLRVRSKTGRSAKLKPLSIPEPAVTLGDGSMKVWPVLGVRGPRTSGNTLVRSGEAIGGFAYYVVNYWGARRYDLLVGRRGVHAVLEVRSILGQRARRVLLLKGVQLERVHELIPNIESVNSSPLTPDEDAKEEAEQTS